MPIEVRGLCDSLSIVSRVLRPSVMVDTRQKRAYGPSSSVEKGEQER